MDFNNKSYLFIRSFIYLCIFDFLHYCYDWFPNIFFQIFSGVNESFFQHWKIGYYAYIILTIGEFLIFWKKIADEGKEKFIYSHLFSAIILPMMIFIIWYTVPAIYGQITVFWIEVVYSIAACYISVLLVSIIEQNFMEIPYNRSLKIIIWILNLLLIIQFTIFSFKLPWVDVFADPYI